MITVFSKQWFKKYSKVITFIARLPFVGELIFNFKKFGHYIDRKRIIEITPNSVIEFVSYKKGKVKLRQHFFSRNEYALRLQKVFYPIWITFHTWDMLIANRFCPQLNLGFDTLTVYPDAGTGNTTVDSNALRNGVDESLSTIQAGAGTVANPTAATCRVSLVASTTSNQFSALYRDILTFDTSSLTGGATISQTVFSVVGNAKINSLGDDDFHITSSTPANDNNVVAADYSQVGSTSFGSKAYADYTVDSGYNDITLNASGISNISKTGISKFGCKIGWDINSSFTGTWSSSAETYMSFSSSDNGSNKPKLVITYTTIVGPANVKTYKGLAAASVKTCKGLAIASIKTKKGLN